MVPEAEQRCAWSRNLDPNFCPRWGRTSIGPWHLAAANVTTRLPRTTHFNRLLRHAGGYSGTILTPNPITKCSLNNVHSNEMMHVGYICMYYECHSLATFF